MVRVEVISFKALVCPFHWHLKIFQIQMFNEKHKAEITNTLCLATSHRVCSTRHGENPFGNHRNLRSNNAVDDHQALVLQTMRLVNMLQSGKNQLTWIAWIQVCISKLLTTFCPARPYRFQDANFGITQKPVMQMGCAGQTTQKSLAITFLATADKVPGWVFVFLVLQELRWA